MARWASGRMKIQLKLAIQRAHMLQDKQESLAKKARREIADLVAIGKIETARVKTESLIMQDVHIELLELLELYCETLYARFALLEVPGTEPQSAIHAPVMALLHAAHRTELQELHVVQDLLVARYGPEVAQNAQDNLHECVPSRVINKLAFHMPPDDLVHAYLREICRAYDVALPGSIEEPIPESENASTHPTPSEHAHDTSSEPSQPGETAFHTEEKAHKNLASNTTAEHTPGKPAEKSTSEWDALMARFAQLKKTT
ncbi:Vacuolar protein sorting-associated protein ist1 [Malassezia psittaci]|uniref:Vacuolar protein sorting-associated protein ist1 n=1 Tax=Malassezia psittaci TaxID=1821823 RepID=A0AAF0F8J2_9BASI|nr:Vacuolar protein sorting-associated protein ist1 [Malassezia psittaci]